MLSNRGLDSDAREAGARQAGRLARAPNMLSHRVRFVYPLSGMVIGG
jgi:hypothetical protein